MKKKLLSFIFLLITAFVHAQTGSGWDWVANSGSATTAPGRQVLDITTDGSGNVYATGRFQGTMTLGGITISTPGVQNASDEDAFIVKYNASGEVQWLKKYGLTGPGSNQFAEVITADNDGNIYVGGLGLSIYTTNSAFLLKYDTNGNLLWSKTDFPLYEIGGINIGPDGNLLVIEQHSSNKNIYKINQSTGAVIWTANVNNAGSNSGTTFQDFTDNAGNVYFTAVKINAINSGDPVINVLGDTYTSTGLASSVIASLDNNGNKRWTQFLEGAEIAHEYTVDKNGKSYTRINGGYGAMFQGISTAQVGGSRYFELNSSGTVTRTMTQSPYKGFVRVKDDGIYGTSTLGSSPYGSVTEVYGDYYFSNPTGAGKALGIVIKYDPNDNDKVVWANSIELNGSANVSGLLRTIEIGSNNKVLMGGYYGGVSVKAGSTTLTATSSGSFPSDFYIAQFNSANIAATSTTTWTGAAGNGTWTDAANWSGGVPTGNEKTVIPAGLSSYPLNIPTTAITGKLTVNSGATLSLPIGFSAPGGLVNNGSVIAIGTGTFQGFNTGTPVPISGTGRIVFTANSPSSILYDVNNSLEINRAGTFLSYGGTVSGSLYLTQGILDVAFFSSIYLTDPAATITASPTSYITGVLKREVSGTGSYYFPVGTSNRFEPLTLTLNSITGTKTISATFTNSNSGSTPSIDLGGKTVSTLLNNGFWTVTPDATPTGGTYDISTVGRVYTNGVTDASRFVTIKREISTAPWAFEGTNGTATQSGETINSGVTSNGVITTSLSGLTKFSDFAIGIATASVAPGTTITTSNWTGTAGDKKWLTAGNWSNGVPNGLTNAVIPTGLSSYPEVFTTGENARSISVAAGAYVKFPYTLKVYSNIVNNGSIEVTTPTGTFSGFGTNSTTGYASLSGSGKLVFITGGPSGITGTINSAIEVNRPGGIFSFNGTVNGNVNILNGDLIYSLSPTYLTMPNADATFTIASSTNHLQGNLIHAVGSNGTYNFPIGNAYGSGVARYTPVSITTSGLAGTQNYNVSFYYSTIGVPKLIIDDLPVTKLLDFGKWTITPNAAATAGTLNITFEGRGQTNGVTDATRYVLLRRKDINAAWVKVDNVVISQTSGVVTATVTNLPALVETTEFAIGIKGAIATWNGSVSTAFATAANWTPAIVPDDSYKLMFVSGSPRYPATFSNSAAMDIAAGTTLTLPQTVNSTAGIINNGTIEVTGSSTFNGFNSGGTPLSGTGKLVFNAASPATISTTTAITNSIEVNRAAGISITAPINGSLILTNGLVAGTVTMTNAASTITYSPTSYITGSLIRAVSTGNYAFPIGTATRYAPATVNFTAISGTTKLTASFSTTTTGTFPTGFVANGKAVSKILNNGIWSIASDVALTGNYSISLEGRGYTNGSTDAANYMVIKRPASNYDWSYSGTATTPAETAGVVTVGGTGLTSFSDFAIGIGAAYATKWTGTAADKKWTTVNNWDNGVPASVQKAVFDNTGTNFPEDFGFSTLTMDKLEVAAGTTIKLPVSSLNAPNGIVNNGTIQTVGNGTFSGFYFGSTPLSGTGKLVFNSASPASISLNTNPVFSHNIEIDRSGLTTSFYGTTNGNVTLTNGLVGTVSGLKFNNPDAVITTSATSYFTGTISRVINATGEYIFPVGTSTIYAPAKLNLNGITGPTLITAFFNTVASGNAPNIAVDGKSISSYLNNGFWTITPNAAVTAGSYGITLEGRKYTNGVEDATMYYAIKRQNSSDNWAFFGTNGTSTQTGGTVNGGIVSNGVVNASASDLTSFSDFAIGIAGSTLPVKISSFSATAVGSASLLNWESVSETNSDKYQIERSLDGSNFYSIGEVKAAGTSTQKLIYSYRDVLPENGMNYYRLKLIDLNGTSSYSEIKSVKFNLEKAGFAAFPNPATETVYLKTAAKGSIIRLVDLSGKLILAQSLQGSSFNIPAFIVNGTYVLNVAGTDGSFNSTMIVIAR